MTKDGVDHVIAVDYGREKFAAEKYLSPNPSVTDEELKFGEGKYAALNVQAITSDGTYSSSKVPIIR